MSAQKTSGFSRSGFVGAAKRRFPLSAILTFDDGWKSQYEVGWPILKKFNYPVTLFIYTEGIKPGHFSGGE